MAENMIKLGIKLDTANADKELQSLIQKLSSNNVKIKIDDKNLNFANISKQLSDVEKQLSKVFDFNKISKSAYESAKVFENEIDSLGEKIGKLHETSDKSIIKKEALQEAKEINSALEEQYKLEQQMAEIRSKADNNKKQREIQEQNELNKTIQEEQKIIDQIENKRLNSQKSSDKTNSESELKQAQAINKALEDQYKEYQKIENSKSTMQSKLNIVKKNDFVDTSVITELQNKLNNINTNTPEKEIKELESAIKNLASSDSSIVRVQNAISKFSISYDNIKNKLNEGSLIGNDQTESKLKQYESELSKLKSLQNELQGGKTFSGSKITSELNGINNASRELNNSLEKNMHTCESFGTRLKDALGNMGVYFTAYQGVMLGVNAIKDAVQTVTSIDTKMRDLRRVTDDATTETLNNFPTQANAMAISLGQTTENAIQATTVWKQLGYSWKDATEYLSKQSMILSNVGDMSAEDSTNALVSTLKAFKLEAKDTTSVVDSLNEAGNRFAIKTGELAEGLRVGGASLAVANNSLEQSEALIITGTEVLRDSNEVANGLKTIAMRLDQVKTAKGDTFYKLQSDLKNIANTDLTDANGNLRSTYDIILDLSKSWNSLSDMNQAKLLDEVAGKNQSKVLSSILQNAQQLPKAYDAMKNSAGSASKEQARFMDSIEAKTNALKESVKKLWLQVISSDTIKQVVDFLTTLVTSLSQVDGSTIKIIATFTALGLALKTIGTFTTTLKGVETIASLGKDAGVLGSLVGGFGRLGTSISGVTSASLAFVATPLGATLTALALATGVAVASYEEYQDIMSKPTLSTTTDDLSTFGKMINSVSGNVIKSKQELIKAGSAYEDFSDDLSDGFKKTVENASKSFNKLKMSLQFDGEQKIFTNGMSQGIKDQVNVIVQTAKDAVLEKKKDVQDTFTKLFTDDDGKLDINESGVLSSIGEYENNKFDTVQALNQKIYDTLNTAVDQHRELTQKDIDNIEEWSRQIQEIELEAKAKNEADEKYSSNESKFKKRLSSMTPTEALDEAKNTYKNIIDINQESEDTEKKTISDATTFVNQWQSEYDKMPDKGSEKALALAKSLDLAKTKITQAQDKLNNEVKTRQEQTKKLWDAFYDVNPDKKGKINEINFTEFNGADIKSNQEFNEVMQWYPQVADVTETSMKRIKNANGTWSDVAVNVDEATGKIVSIYDTTTGTVAGYSKQFEDDAEKTYSNLYNAQAKIESLMNDTYSKTNSGSNFKLDNDNNFSIVDDKGIETTIEKMQQVIQLSDGYKVAVANINGKQIKMEFDKDGSLKNYEDVLSAINGDKNSKALVDFDVNTEEGKKKLEEIEKQLLDVDSKKVKINVDGQESDSIINDTIKKLQELKESNPNAKITIDGEEISTIDEAIEKLSQVQPNTNTDVIVNTEEANDNLDTTKGKVDTLDSASANPQVHLNTNGAESSLNNILADLNKINGTVASATVKIGTSGASAISQIEAKFETQTNASGTDNAKAGWSSVSEEGFEIMIGKQYKKLNGGETILNNSTSKEFLKALGVANNGDNNDTETTEQISIKMPNLLSVKTVQETPKNDIYQGKENETGILDVNKANTLDKPYVPDVDTSNMSDEEKKAYDAKKKAEDEEEKKLKDKADKEKQYLDDIGSYWDTNSKSIQQSIKELELKEDEYGKNITVSQKMDILNQKYQRQVDLLPEAEKQLNTYKNTSVTTAEGQEELGKKIQEATDTLISQKKAVIDAYNELKEYQQETLSSFRDTLASDIKQEAEKLEKDITTAKESQLKTIEEQKQAEIDAYDTQIKSLQNELKALENDSVEDNQKKLEKLQQERALWAKETDNVFAKSKIEQLDSQINEAKKAVLQSKINDINDKKQETSDSYDSQTKYWESYYSAREEELKKNHKELESEEEAYAKADKLIKTNNQKAILKLMSNYSQSYKDVGTLLGKNFKEGWQEQINEARTIFEQFSKDVGVEISNNSNGSNESSSSSNSSSSSSSSNNGVSYTSTTSSGVSYTSGTLSNGSSYTIASKPFASYDTGGRTPSDIDNGALAVLHSDEKILNADETVKFDESMSKIGGIYDYIKSSGGLFAQLSQSYANINGYSVPSLNSIDLNKLANSVVNNTTDNSVVQPNVEMSVSITNNNGSEAVMNEKSLEKLMTKVIQKSATKYGGKGFNNR